MAERNENDNVHLSYISESNLGKIPSSVRPKQPIRSKIVGQLSGWFQTPCCGDLTWFAVAVIGSADVPQFTFTGMPCRQCQKTYSLEVSSD